MHPDFEQYAAEVRGGLKLDGGSDFLQAFKTLDAFEEEEASWLIPGWLPEGQITLLASDGGIGKTSIWINIVAALSSGQRCLLDPPDYMREP